MESSLDRVKTAMFAGSFPCNPKPFAVALFEHFDAGSITSDEAKQVLWVLMAQAYGQLATIDLCEEYKRLSDLNRQRSEEG